MLNITANAALEVTYLFLQCVCNLLTSLRLVL